jgi:RNA polymerase sigma-70 factor (ECF subfamily)
VAGTSGLAGRTGVGMTTPRKAAGTSRGVVDPTDADVIARVLAGDGDAYRVLVERYQGRAYALAVRVLRDEEAAQDAVQDAFVKAWSALNRFEGRSSFFTWFYRLVMNQCLDMKRRDKADRQLPYEEDGTADVTPEASMEAVPEVAGVAFAPAASVMQKELRRALAVALESLPEQARETLVLREIDGLSYAEIAQALDIPKGTVMSRLYYARKQMQKRLQEADIPLPPSAAAGETT